MGNGRPPKPASRLSGGAAGGSPTGLEAIAQFGVGKCDASGVYEAYDIPEGHAAAQTRSESDRKVTWPELVEQFALIEADFSSEYSIELEDVLHIRTWRWFNAKVAGLMVADTRIARHFRPVPAIDPRGIPNE